MEVNDRISGMIFLCHGARVTLSSLAF